MANALMALSVANPQMNTMGAFAQGQQHATDQKTQQLEHAKQNFTYLAQMAHDAQGDPAAWDAGLEALSAAGWQVDQFRGRPDLAPMLAKSALTAEQELSNNYNQQQLDISRRRLAHDMSNAAKAPPPTAAQQNWDWAGDDPARQQYLGIGQAAGARPMTADERGAWGIPETDTGAYSIEPGKAPQRIGGAPSGGASAPSGYRPSEDGNLTYIPGGPADPVNKPRAEFNVSQATAAGYADRMTQADAIISTPDLSTVQTDVWERGKSGVPLVGNMLVSSEFQQADQAQRDFINAILRRESGAVISDNEFANANRQYFPQPGDNKEVLAQKAANRKNAINGVARSAGPAYQSPDTTNYLTGAPAAGGNAGSGWEVIGVEE